MTERAHAPSLTERRLWAQCQVSSALAGASTLAEAAPSLLRAIGLSLGWTAGTLWSVDEAHEVLLASATWCSAAGWSSGFDEATRSLRFARGAGIAGKVWATGEATFQRDPHEESLCERSGRRALLACMDLRCGVWIPARAGARVQAVLEFLCRDGPAPDPGIMATLLALGEQIGQFAARLQAERALKEVEERCRRDLERRVAARTAELEASNRRLTEELALHRQVHRALRAGRDRFERFLDTEIIQRERTTAALKEAEERWQLALRGNNDGIWDWNVRTNQIFFSTRWKEIVGFTEQELSGSLEAWERLVHPDDRASVNRLIRDHFAKKTPFYVSEHRVICKDGSCKWVLSRGQALWDDAGNVVRMTGSHTDITERKRLEAERERERRKLQTLIDCAPVGIFEMDPSGKCLFVNRRWCEIMATPAERALGEGWIDVVHPDDRARVDEVSRAAVRRGEELYLECRRVGIDGSVGWVCGRIVVIRDPDGAVATFLGMAEDITERKRTEILLAMHNEQLERRVEERTAALRAEEERRTAVAVENARLYQQAKEAVEARDEFLSIASHELRTPITPLQLQLQSLRRLLNAAAVDPAALAKLDVALRQVERMTKLIDNLLEVSRITTGRLELHLEDCDFAEIVRDVAARFVEQAAKAGCPLVVHAATPVVGRWDRLRIEQVVVNLLSNAIKYAPGKPVEIEVVAADARCRLLVRDHGIGIPPADMARIFGRFERAAPTRNYAGLGLGLYIISQILSAHGGTIQVDSPPDDGARFVVELPRSSA